MLSQLSSMGASLDSIPLRLTGRVTPQNFNFKVGPCDGNPGKTELERASIEVVRALKKLDRWCTFTFAEYKAFCSPRRVFDAEVQQLELLVKAGQLSKKNAVYSVEPRLFWSLSRFIELPKTKAA